MGISIVLLILSAGAVGAGPKAESCGPSFKFGLSRLVARATGRESAGDKLARAISALKLEGKATRNYSFEVLERPDPSQPKVKFEIFEGSLKVGSGELVASPEGEVTWNAFELKSGGLEVASAIAKVCFDTMPSGQKIRLASKNDATNLRLTEIAGSITAREEYRRLLRSDPRAARRHVEREVTREANDRYARGAPDGVAWVNLLRKAGWHRIDVWIRWEPLRGGIAGFDLSGNKAGP